MNDSTSIDAALSLIVDRPATITLPASMVWLRGRALRRQAEATKSLRVVGMFTTATLSLALLFGMIQLLHFV